MNDPVALTEGLALIRCGRPAPAETEDIQRVVSAVIGDLTAFVEQQGCPLGDNPFTFRDVPDTEGTLRS